MLTYLYVTHKLQPNVVILLQEYLDFFAKWGKLPTLTDHCPAEQGLFSRGTFFLFRRYGGYCIG